MVLSTLVEGLSASNCHQWSRFSAQLIPQITLSFLVVAASLLWFFRSSRKIEHWPQKELASFGTPRESQRLGKVVICGGGIAGLLAAKTCTNHFEEVVLIDPEFSKVSDGKQNARVMQYNSTHGYLVLFAEGLRRLWPSFEERVKEVGGYFLSGDFFLHFSGVYTPVPDKGYPKTFSMRRGQLEPLLHRLLLSDRDSEEKTQQRLCIIDGQVKEIRASSDKSRLESVHGVTVNQEAFDVTGVDLVIDCTGATQSGLKWLSAADFRVPARIEHNPHLGYVTVTFTVSEQLAKLLPIPGGYDDATWIYTFHADSSFGNAAFLFGKMDGRTIQLCCASWGPYDLPKESGSIVKFITSLRSIEPIPAWVFETAELLAEYGEPQFSLAKIPFCSYIQYHDAQNLPTNLIAIGDSTMQLNPVFGQGCGKLMAGSLLLDRMLRSCHDGVLPPSFAKEYFGALEERLRGTWNATKAIDYGFPNTQPTKGETLEVGSSLRKLMKIFRMAAEVDGQISLTLWKTRQLLAPESTLKSPSFLARVALAFVRRGYRRAMGIQRRYRTVQVCHK